MYLLHTADWHLDSSFESVYPVETARIRRNELYQNFLRMVTYAATYKIAGILIAGDWFDTPRVSATLLSRIYAEIAEHADIQFYCVLGNHDGDVSWNPPPNLHLFGDTFSLYTLESEGEKVSIYGCSSPETADYENLSPPVGETNFVMMHGNASETPSGPDTVLLPALRHKNIDYLALGHIHSPSETPLDARGVYVYPGIPEGRFFDETGKKGFFLLRIKDGKIQRKFISTAAREIHILSCPTEESALVTLLASLPKTDIVRLEVQENGKIPVYLAENLLQKCGFFYSEVAEVKAAKQTASDNPADFRDDISLRGEFVRTVESADLSESEKAEILRYGLAALRGEEADTL